MSNGRNTLEMAEAWALSLAARIIHRIKGNKPTVKTGALTRLGCHSWVDAITLVASVITLFVSATGAGFSYFYNAATFEAQVAPGTPRLVVQFRDVVASLPLYDISIDQKNLSDQSTRFLPQFNGKSFNYNRTDDSYYLQLNGAPVGDDLIDVLRQLKISCGIWFSREGGDPRKYIDKFKKCKFHVTMIGHNRPGVKDSIVVDMSKIITPEVAEMICSRKGKVFWSDISSNICRILSDSYGLPADPVMGPSEFRAAKVKMELLDEANQRI